MVNKKELSLLQQSMATGSGSGTSVMDRIPTNIVARVNLPIFVTERNHVGGFFADFALEALNSVIIS
jgi:hypothetical protein